MCWFVIKKGCRWWFIHFINERQNTGTNDGEYELPGGHLEYGEDLIDAMIREAKEEVLIDLKREDLKIIHLLHCFSGERLNFIFEAEKEVNPQIG